MKIYDFHCGKKDCGLLKISRFSNSSRATEGRDQPGLESEGFARCCRNLRVCATVPVRWVQS